jgi:hypothetical protein
VGRGHAVDHVQHRYPLALGPFGEVIETVRGDGAENQAVRLPSQTFFDLSALDIEVAIAAGFVNGQADAETAGLIDQSVVDRQPISVLEVRNGNADAPFLTCFLRRHVGFLNTLSSLVERGLPDIDLDRIPGLVGLDDGGGQYQRGSQDTPGHGELIESG